VFTRTRKLLCTELCDAFERSSRRTANRQRHSRSPAESIEWLADRLAGIRTALQLRDLKYEVAERIHGSIASAIIRTADLNPRLATRIVSEMLRIEAQPERLPSTGLAGAMGKARYHEGLNWVRRTLTAVRTRSALFRRTIPRAFRPTDPTAPDRNGGR
jgi:hypothetical protein